MGKNKQKITLLFIFIILIITTATVGCSNSLSTQKELPEEEEAQDSASNNYQGLRIETKDLNLEELADSYPRIVCFGDSVTFGWNVDYKNSYPNLLEGLLREDYAKVKVINSGIGGNTVLEAYDRVENDVIGYNPHLVVINFGLNDGRIQEENEYENENGAEEPVYDGDKEDPPVPNVDLETFSKYYSLIVDKIKSADIKIILMGMNSVLVLSSAENNIDAEEQIEIYKNYNDEVRKIAVNSHIDFIDLWNIFESNDKTNDYLQGDGIHPNEEGFKLIANIVYEVIRSYNFQ
jgi:lysophospholipase L1-like esterase